ncbi:YqjF family protein [soil metagenome]
MPTSAAPPVLLPIRPQGPPLRGPAIMSQHWCDLAFLHWRIAPELVAVHLPPGVRPDEFDGSAWVGLIPFRMVDAGPGRGHPVPWLGTFWESNVRVYTTDDAGRRGVNFMSLETERAAVVLGARGVFNVPYYWARMGGSRGGSAPGVHSVRDYWTTRLAPHRSRPASGVSLQIGERLAEPGPLEHFLTARFGLHTRVLGQTLWVPNTHGPWPLHSARVTRLEDQLVRASGLPDLPARTPPDSVLWSPGVYTEFGLPQRV